VSRDLDVGKVFSTTFGPDPQVAFRLAVAGSKGTMHVWDTSTNAAVRRAFAGKLPNAQSGEDVKERLVGVADDESESEDEEDGAEEAGSGDGEGEDEWMDED
jgi:periodic tryptophan protein 1